jgi:hypothetical protein
LWNTGQLPEEEAIHPVSESGAVAGAARPGFKPLAATFFDRLGEPVVTALAERAKKRGQSTVSTICIGTGVVLMAHGALSEELKERTGQPLQLSQVFACELRAQKNIYWWQRSRRSASSARTPTSSPEKRPWLKPGFAMIKMKCHQDTVWDMKL